MRHNSYTHKGVDMALPNTDFMSFAWYKEEMLNLIRTQTFMNRDMMFRRGDIPKIKIGTYTEIEKMPTRTVEVEEEYPAIDTSSSFEVQEVADGSVVVTQSDKMRHTNRRKGFTNRADFAKWVQSEFGKPAK